MSPGLFLDNKKYISAKEASSVSGYSQDYIGQLARAGKISSKRIGRNWYISEESILNYKDFANELGLVQETPTLPVESFLPELKKKPEPSLSCPEVKISKLDPACITIFTPPSSVVQNPRTLPASVGKLLAPSLGIIFLGIILNANGIDLQKSLGKLLGNFGENLTANVSSTTEENNKRDFNSNLLAQALTQKTLISLEQLRSAFKNFVSSPKTLTATSSPSSTTIIVKETVKEVPVKVISDSGLEIELRKLLADPAITSLFRGPRGSDGEDGETPDTSNLVTKDFLEGQVETIFDSNLGESFVNSLEDDLAASITTGALEVNGDATVDSLLIGGSTANSSVGTIQGTQNAQLNFINENSSADWSIGWLSNIDNSFKIWDNNSSQSRLTIDTTSGLTTLSGLVTITSAPTLAHSFSPWPSGTSNVSNSSLFINPASAVGDGNLIGAAVAGSVKFLVDAEGDIYGNNLILTGSTSQGTTNVAGDLVVQDHTDLGDSAADTVTISGYVDSNVTFTKSDPALIFNSPTATDTDFWFGVQEDGGGDDDDVFQIGDGATPGTNPFLTIDTSGNIGVGTTTPGYKLNIVQGNTQFGYNNSGDTSRVILGSTNEAGDLGRIDFQAMGVGNRASIVGATNTLKFTTQGTFGNTESMRIDVDGDVGIGTTNPQYKLDVSGAGTTLLRIAGGSGQGAGLTYAGDTSWIVGPGMGTLSNANDFGIYDSTGTTVHALTIKADTGNVGIGTTNPSNKLEVSGNANILGSLLFTTETAFVSGPSIRNQAGGNLIFTGGVNGFTFNKSDNSVTQMVINSSGLVGIGTSSAVSGTRLTLDTPSGSDGAMRLRNGTATRYRSDTSIGSGGLSINSYDDTAVAYLPVAISGSSVTLSINNTGGSFTHSFGAGNSRYAVLDNLRIAGGDTSNTIYQNTGAMGIRTAGGALTLDAGGANSLSFQTNSTDRMTILSGGNVGIGTTNPGTKLDIWAANGDGMYVRDTSGNIGALAYMDGTAGVLQTRSGGSVTNEIKGSGVVYFNSGNVGIGTTNPQAKLQINAAAGTNALIFKNTTASGNQDWTMYSSGATNSDLIFYDGGARMVLENGGNIGIGTTDPSATLHVGGQSLISPTSLDADVTGLTGTPLLGLVGNNTTADAIVSVANAANTTGAHFYGLKTRASSGSDANTVVASGDQVLAINGYAADGASYRIAGGIAIAIDGTPGSSDMPGRITFSTTADGASSQTERMRINSAGNVGIGTTDPSLARLQVVSNTAQLVLQNTSGGSVDVKFLGTGGLYNWKISKDAVTNDNLEFIPSTAADGTTFSTPVLVIKRSGEVGIGTTNPGAKLDVSINGSVYGLNVRAADGFHMRFADTNNNQHGTLTAGGSALTFGGFTSGVLFNTGNVGIGTTNPGTTLDVVAATNISGITSTAPINANLFLNNTTGSGSARRNWLLSTNYDTNGDFAIRSSTAEGGNAYSVGSTRFLINSSGNVGIGTTNPSAGALQIGGSLTGNTGVLIQPATGTAAARFRINTTGNDTTFGAESSTGGTLFSGSTAYATIIGNVVARPIEFYTNSAFAMTIASGGNVGIGTTNPTQKLDITGNIVFRDSAPSFEWIDSDDSSNYRIRQVGGETVLDVDYGNETASSSFGLYIDGTASANLKLMVNSSGSVGIGTTSPGSKLHVYNGNELIERNDASPLLSLRTSSANTFNPEVYLGEDTASGGSILYDATNNVFNINTGTSGPAALTPRISILRDGGNVGIGTTNPSTLLHLSNATDPTLTVTDTTNTVNTLVQSGDTSSFIGTGSAHSLNIGTNGSGRLVIDSSGNFVFNEDGNDSDFRIESDTNSNHFISDAGQFSGAGSFGFGAAANDTAFIQLDPSARTAIVGNDYYRLNISNNGAITTAASGTHSIIAGLRVAEPNITIGTAAVTNAASIYVPSAPTEASNNYALFIDSGTARFDSTVTVGTMVSQATAGTTSGIILANNEFLRGETSAGANTTSLIGMNSSDQISIGAQNNTVVFGSNRLVIDGSGNLVFNEDGNDSDFRIESDTNANLITIDAGNNNVGFGASPNARYFADFGGAGTNAFVSTATGSSDSAYVLIRPSSVANTSGTGNIANIIISGGTSLNPAGVSTWGAGLILGGPSEGGAGSFTNMASLFIEESPTAGSNNYSLYSAGTANSYFAGKVGIGTVSPGSQQLAIVGGAGAAASTTGAIRVGSIAGGTDAGLTIGYLDSNYSYLQSWGGQPLLLNPISNGVGINTTSVSVALDVVGSIEYTGDITDVSDARLKENITDFMNGLSIINSIGVKKYNMIATPEESDVGFIAQNVRDYFPEAVSVVDPENGYLGVSYVSFVPILTKAVQELDAKIEAITGEGLAGVDSIWDDLVEKFADAANGIQELFAEEIYTKNLCVQKSNGDDVCITGDELEALLINAGQPVNSGSGSTSSPQDDPEPVEGEAGGTDGGSEESPVDETPVEEPALEEEVPVEEAPAEEPVVEETPTEEPAPEETP